MNTAMQEPTSASVLPSNKSGLFRVADDKLAVTLVRITSLFLLWGFCNGMISYQ